MIVKHSSSNAFERQSVSLSFSKLLSGEYKYSCIDEECSFLFYRSVKAVGSSASGVSMQTSREHRASDVCVLFVSSGDIPRRVVRWTTTTSLLVIPFPLTVPKITVCVLF